MIYFIKFIYINIKKYFEKLRQLREKENSVLINEMPKWYSFYQYSLLSRVIRFSSLVIITSPWYTEVVKVGLKKLNLYNILNIDTETYLIIYSLVYFLAFFYLLSYIILQILIRIIFFKKIFKNSHKSKKK